MDLLVQSTLGLTLSNHGSPRITSSFPKFKIKNRVEIVFPSVFVGSLVWNLIGPFLFGLFIQSQEQELMFFCKLFIHKNSLSATVNKRFCFDDFLSINNLCVNAHRFQIVVRYTSNSKSFDRESFRRSRRRY